MRVCVPFLAVAGLMAFAPSSATAQAPTRDDGPRGEPLVVTTEWLASRLQDPQVVVVEVVSTPGERTERIPGARELAYRHITVRRDSLTSELPPADSLRSLFEGLGISSGSHVVVYAQDAPLATRLLFTLVNLGHRNASYLDGGLVQWKAEGRPLATSVSPFSRGTMAAVPGNDLVVTADWLTARIGKPGVSLIDTRTLGEYNGTGNRSGMPSAGHLAGAQQLEWEWLFEADQPLRLKSRDALRALYAERIRPGDVVVTYCWIGYRGSATWFVARLLGHDARLYDGSYQDWQRRALPVTAGDKP
jgi:thiosulfate/3-mercaptopyruvate sulfurtransferase